MAHLSELTHCFARIYSPFFRTVQADQDHTCPTLLVRNWCCSRKAGDWCFPQQVNMVNVRQKKKETRKRGRKNISFREYCKFRAPKSQRFLNQKVFVLSSALFLTMLRRRRAPSWDLPCQGLCLYLDTLSLRRARTSTFLAVKNRLENGTQG